MGRKSVIPGYKLLDAGDLGANHESVIVNVQNLDYASIHVSWSGATTPSGTYTIQARNGSNDSFYTVSTGTHTVSGAAGDLHIVLSDLPYSDLKLVYARTSGSGTANAYITAKVRGA